jgi:TonB-dependent starch-binding outer membrane protein SusC
MKKNFDLWVYSHPTLKKLIMELKIAFLIVLVSATSVFATPSYSQGARVSLDFQSSTVESVMDEIEIQSEFYFIFNQKQIDINRVVDIQVNDELITAVLPELFNNTDVNYAVFDRKILLTTDPINNSLIAQGTDNNQQQKKITGIVSDKNGPIPGANVVVTGTTTGTITDMNGKYSLDVPQSAVSLTFTFIGMEPQQVDIGNSNQLDVTMSQGAIGLDEVIVVGYGTQKKSDLTGSVVRISMADKVSAGNVTLSQALTGASAGVNLESRGGAYSEPTLSVRGRTSLSASDRPLVVVDGIIYNGSISNININDVESVDVLKDASSAAVYGSRSANGVLLITTKKGKSQKPVISFNMYKGFQDMTNNPMKVMNGDEFATRLLDWEYQEDVYNWYETNPTSAAGRPVRPDATDRNVVGSYLRTYEEQQNYLDGKETNWVDEVLQIAPMQNYNLSLQGGADNLSYYLSTSYSDVEGIQLNDQFKRFNLRSNLESKVNDWLTVGLNASYAHRDNSGIATSLSNARRASPLATNYIGQDNYDIFLGGELFQPYPLINQYIDNNDISNELFAVGSAKIKVPWVEGLQYEFNYSHTYSTRNNNTYNDSNTPAGVSNRGLAVKNPSEGRDWIVNNIVTYSREFGNHQVNSTFLFSREGRNGNASTLRAEGFDNEVLGYNNMGLGEIASVSTSAYEENSLSYMGRVNYSYLSRYMITATVRRDGFSGFGAGNKWATFPSASLAWVATKEAFLQDLGFYLKFRTSYGKNGNQGIGRYSSLSRMGTSYYVYGPSTAIGLYPSTLANSDLGWETTTSYNFGMDLGFFNNRLTGSLDVYTASTEDVLVRRQLPRSSGYANVWTNIGGIDNKGVEIELKSINIDNNDLRWESSFVFALNRDKINRLYGGENDRDIGNSWFVGESMSAIYDYEMAGGVWTEDEFFNGNAVSGWYPGQFRYVDQNADGGIDPTNDRKVLGYSAPSYRFSINNAVTYKDFTFSLFINSIQGGDDYYLANNAQMINPLFYMQHRMNNSAINAYWRPEAPTTNTTGIYNNPQRQSGIYQSRSFVRIQDVSLTYSLDQRLLSKLGMQSCQIYVSGKNPYVWTKWQGWDPEIGVSDTPLMRNIITGIRLSF